MQQVSLKHTRVSCLLMNKGCFHLQMMTRQQFLVLDLQNELQKVSTFKRFILFYSIFLELTKHEINKSFFVFLQRVSTLFKTMKPRDVWFGDFIWRQVRTFGFVWVFIAVGVLRWTVLQCQWGVCMSTVLCCHILYSKIQQSVYINIFLRCQIS